MPQVDQATTIQELRDVVLKFRNDRDWEQFHTPKDLALAIGIEAGELGEHFLWKKDAEIQAMLQDPTKIESLGDEMADVFVYLLSLADVLKIDITTSLSRKMEKNAKKYPVDKAKGNSKKYTEL